MTTADLDRLTGMASWVALVALVLSGIALALFFGGAGQFWGPVNDALIVISVISLIPVVVGVIRAAGDRGAPWILVISVAAVAGLVLIATGQTLLIVGRLSLEGSFVTGGVGVVPVLAWIVVVAILGLAGDVLPREVGWLAAACLVAIVAISIVAMVTRGPALWVAAVALVILLAAWLARLAIAFGDRPTA